MPTEEHGGPLSVSSGTTPLSNTCPWLVAVHLPWQIFGVCFEQVTWLCFNPRACVPLESWDLGLGYD